MYGLIHRLRYRDWLVFLLIAIVIPAFIGYIIWYNVFEEYEPTLKEMCENACFFCYGPFAGGEYDCDIDLGCFQECMSNPAKFFGVD